jgi:hypothetical protein
VQRGNILIHNAHPSSGLSSAGKNVFRMAGSSTATVGGVPASIAIPFE